MNDAKMNRERWVEVFVATGLDEKTMQHWHAEFERRYPEGHQAFLEWINLPAGEIVRLRQLSQAA